MKAYRGIKVQMLFMLKVMSGQHHAMPSLCLGREAGWAAELVSTRGEEKHFLTMVGFEPQFLGHPS